MAVNSVNGKTGDVVLTKQDIGLGNVDNTSDLDKPISRATAAALANKMNKLADITVTLNDANDKGIFFCDQVNARYHIDSTPIQRNDYIQVSIQLPKLENTNASVKIGDLTINVEPEQNDDNITAKRITAVLNDTPAFADTYEAYSSEYAEYTKFFIKAKDPNTDLRSVTVSVTNSDDEEAVDEIQHQHFSSVLKIILPDLHRIGNPNPSVGDVVEIVDSFHTTDTYPVYIAAGYMTTTSLDNVTLPGNWELLGDKFGIVDIDGSNKNIEDDDYDGYANMLYFNIPTYSLRFIVRPGNAWGLLL